MQEFASALFNETEANPLPSVVGLQHGLFVPG